MTFQSFLDLLNETLTTAIVVVAASMLLYNLSRNVRDRVARTSGIVLACLTAAYISDVLILLGPDERLFEALLRLQWLGLAFIPTATMHLSDALLETTGLPSRGRRRRAILILYAIGAAFLILAAFTDVLIKPETHAGRISARAAVMFWVYLAYFIPTNLVAFINVHRARSRCLTRSTRRRMAYLQVAMLMPSIGIFPYSVLLNPGEEYAVGALILVNAANFMVVLTLLLLSYPLSFFGSRIPDRVVKTDLLRFMLLGPATGMLALVVILYSGPVTEVFAVPGETFMPFAVIAVILLWQWSVDLALPWLEKRLIYRDEDDAQLAKLDNLTERLLTPSDMLQLVDANLEATCDYLQVTRAFMSALIDQTPTFVRSVGSVQFTSDELQTEMPGLLDGFSADPPVTIQSWGVYWVIPLHSKRISDRSNNPTLIGLMAIEAQSDEIDLTDDEQRMLQVFVKRAARILDDMLLQNEIFAALEGLLPQIAMTRGRAAEVEYQRGRKPELITNGIPERSQLIAQVHAALRHFWGGPGLSSSRLLELSVVRQALDENEDNDIRALRAILLAAVENQRPEGQPDMKSTEWTLYNILKLRFIDNRKVRETARRLYMSEANLYRKQNVAIEAVTDTIIEMERNALTS